MRLVGCELKIQQPCCFGSGIHSQPGVFEHFSSSCTIHIPVAVGKKGIFNRHVFQFLQTFRIQPTLCAIKGLLLIHSMTEIFQLLTKATLAFALRITNAPCGDGLIQIQGDMKVSVIWRSVMAAYKCTFLALFKARSTLGVHSPA